jgi:predicted nucleic acid-binding protein
LRVVLDVMVFVAAWCGPDGRQAELLWVVDLLPQGCLVG